MTLVPILAQIPSPSQNTIEIGPLTIFFYGILIALGVVVAIVVSRNRYVRFGGDGSLFESVAIWGIVIGFLGARLGYVSTHTARFAGRPWAVLFIWEGGLALYGGLVAGALTVAYLLRRRNGDVFAFGDAAAIGVPLAQAFGRWGNYFNQELFGTPSDLPWAIIIDPVNRPAEYAQFETFHPTFLYESLWNALILVPVILLLERAGKLYKGASFGLYIAMYATIRFFMELLRTDTTFRFLGISRNGWVSVAGVLFGLAWFYYCQKRGEKRTLIGKPTLFSPQPATVAAEVGSSLEHDAGSATTTATAESRDETEGESG
jgi:prolipoprotein diacylglyceryl transferase